MSKEILIQKDERETKVAILENGKLDDFFIEVEHHQSILGNIYKGKVESILPSINGAFVNIGQERNGFLYLTDAANPLIEETEESGGGQPVSLLNRFFNPKKTEKKPEEEKTDKGRRDNRRRGRRFRKPSPNHLEKIPLKENQELLVQVVKDPFSKKGARLTTHISLAGRFIVYMPFDAHNGVSKKIESAEERQRLKGILKEFNFAKSGGFIVRTASKGKSRNELLRDAKFLCKIWSQIQRLSQRKEAPSLIYKEYDLVWKIIRDYMTDQVERLTIDNHEDYVKIRKFVQNLISKAHVQKVHLYRGSTPLFHSRKIAKELEGIYDPRVELKSGAHIVIEPTEGLIVVDVNSGKFRIKASPEEAAFMVNMEAAPEIARHLRLRDLGGIIVIDFIDMQKEQHKRKVLECLQQALADDPAKSEVNRISSLGLVEMTRARTGKNLEAISFKNCPYCDGRGKIKIA